MHLTVVLAAANTQQNTAAWTLAMGVGVTLLADEAQYTSHVGLLALGTCSYKQGGEA